MKKYFILSATLFCFLFMGRTDIFAIQANPNPIKINQPDGTEITIHIRGDEYYHWFEDVDGYTVIKDTGTKYWTYAKKDFFGDLKPSENVVGKVSPKKLDIEKSLKNEFKLTEALSKRKDVVSLQQTTLLKHSLRLNSEYAVSKSASSDGAVQKVSPSGKKTNFVLLVQFSDLKFTDNPPFTSYSDDDSGHEAVRTAFYNLFNKTGYNSDGAVGSVKDYFKEVSYGALNYESVISPVITINQSHTYYADDNDDSVGHRTGALIKAALEQMHSSYPTFLRDNVWPDTSITEPEGFTVIHAGGGAEYGNKAEFIWSHAQYFENSVGNTVNIEGITFNRYHTEPAGRGYYGNSGITRIGVICHESLHFFGLPDLYDTTYASSGLGAFSVMASGSWNGSSPSGERDGKCPGHPDAWCKYTLGWITPQTPAEGINYIGVSSSDSTAFYEFDSSNSTFPSQQYFLMENRQSYGFDAGLPGNKRGLLIYHIDESRSNNDNPYRYLVDIEEADGTADWTQDHLATNKNELGRDSDYYRSGTTTVFNDTCVSSPNSRSYNGVASGINIVGITASSSNMAFAYGNVDVYEDLSNVLSYPNPARNGYMYITNLPITASDFSAEVFTIKGNLVKSFSQRDIEFAKDDDTILGKIKWLLKNESGENVAPGVYIVMIKANDKIKKYKVAVIR
ncbi:MAG: M6 family metalloprotease domain-containing protein [Elusimicrobia bacterium]|nr:M6 family metalloprotease domain-containing protein [Elusimicrobiota bacterium]